MCLGMNPDVLEPGERSASTSNRNFEGRQGRATYAPRQPGDGCGRRCCRALCGREGVGFQVKAVRRVEGTMAPMPQADIDTDQIIPKQFLKRIERSGFGPFAFYDWACTADGEPSSDFVLNRPEYTDARVLVTGPNFGCGSSREHAPWALQDRGFSAIIAPSFADIFRNNCAKIGLLCVTLADEEVAELIEIATTTRRAPCGGSR